MKIISWNVNGIRAVVKKEFFEALKRTDWDILCLQETKAQDIEVEQVLEPFSAHSIYYNSAQTKGYSGTTLISKEKPVSYGLNMGVAEHDMEGRVICAEYPGFYLVNVYVPNSGQELNRLGYRQQWDADFLGYLKEKEKTKPVIACGDFNVAHRPIDLKNDKSNYNKTAGYTQVEIDGMDNLIHSGFVDSFRYLHRDEVAYTYWSYRFKARERNVGWRLDYFLVSESLISKVNAVKIWSDIHGSDHCPIELDINMDTLIKQNAGLLNR